MVRVRGFSLRQGLAALVLVSAGPLGAQPSVPAQVTAQAAPAAGDLAAALLAYGSGEVPANDLRNIECDAVGDTAGALDCRWEQRTGQSWRLHTTWLALVAGRWTVLDAPLVVPEFNRGRLKPLPKAGAGAL